MVLCDEDGKVLQEASKLIGETTNNRAEYQAMLLALQLAAERKAKHLKCHADSELLVFQLQGTYRIKDLHLKALAEKVKSLASRFEAVTYRQVPREHPMIARADKLLNRSLDQAKAGAARREGTNHSPSAEPAQGELF